MPGEMRGGSGQDDGTGGARPLLVAPEAWKKLFDGASNGSGGRGLLGLIRRIALRTPDPPSDTGAKIRWAVQSDQVEEAERSIRQRVDAANAQSR